MMWAPDPPIEWAVARGSNARWLAGFLGACAAGLILGEYVSEVAGVVPAGSHSGFAAYVATRFPLLAGEVLAIVLFALLVPMGRSFGFSPKGVVLGAPFGRHSRLYAWKDVFVRPGRLHLIGRWGPIHIALEPLQEAQIRRFLWFPSPPS